MSCADVRLGEFLDGELDGDARQAVEAHLPDCAACRGELESLKKLETVLKSVPKGSMPESDRFLQGVRAKSRVTSGGMWRAAAAAALMLGLLGYLLWPSASVDVAAELAAYAKKPSDTSESRIRDAGAAGMAVLEDALEKAPDPQVRFAAAVLLFKHAGDATRDRVLTRFQNRETNGSWVLNEPGVDDEDVELVPVAVDALGVEGQQEWALDVLRKLKVLNLEAREKVIDSVVTLLKHSNPEVQRRALDIVEKLEIEFPLSAIVDLLDSPELGDQALKVLREATGRDFGKDKEAWKKAIESKEDKS